MRLILATASAALLACPALAETGSTLENVTKRGIVMRAFGLEIPVNYTPDGRWTAPTVQVAGTWRIDGERLCTRTTTELTETCAAYPQGKKPGDSFEVPGAMGSEAGVVVVKINAP